VAVVASVAVLVGACATGPSHPGGVSGPGAAAPGTGPALPAAAGDDPTTTPRSPVRVLLAGDSVMRNLAPALKAALGDGGRADVRFILAAVIQNDPTVRITWEEQLRTFRPEIAVMFIGSWETFEIIRHGGVLGDPAWRAQYERDILDPWVQFITSGGARVVWVGNAVAGDPAVTDNFAAYDNVLRALPERWPQVTFVTSAVALNGSVGPGYHDVVMGDDGVPVRTRQTDGLHLCADGAARLAAVVVDALAPAVVARPGWDSGPWRRDTAIFPPEKCPPVG
jgi:hypothetical protein